MKHKSIKYIAFFDKQDSVVERNYVTSASNKIEYIANSIVSNGKKVEIISVAAVTEGKFRLYPSEKKLISNGITLRLPFSWGGSNVILKKLKVLWHLIDLLFYLFFNCGKNDTVIVYHSLGYFDIIRWIKRIRKFKMILEVEEIYSDVSSMSNYWRNLEFRMFNTADAFILSNDLLDAKINKYHKPSVVIYGTYYVEPKRVEKFNDGKIHVIYAGTFDPNKGGAQTSIMAAEFLSESFHIHICGFGHLEEVESVKKQISEIQSKSKASITYDGLKKSNDFIEFLQQCHIGLSTQKPEGKYNDTSFPSKVLTYMANGLAVVSIRIPVLEKATISDAISFYNIPKGEEIAEAIRNCEFEKSQIEILHYLDIKFKKDINNII